MYFPLFLNKLDKFEALLTVPPYSTVLANAVIISFPFLLGIVLWDEGLLTVGGRQDHRRRYLCRCA